MAENEQAETDEVAEEEAHPEPKPVGHGVVQDNVSDEGVQHTHQVDESGEVTDTSSHGGENDEAPAEDGEVESDDALVGAAGSAGADDGSGDGDADDEE